MGVFGGHFWGGSGIAIFRVFRIFSIFGIFVTFRPTSTRAFPRHRVFSFSGIRAIVDRDPRRLHDDRDFPDDRS